MVRTFVPTLCVLSALALGACSQQNADFMPGGGAAAAPSASAAPPASAPALPAVAQRASTLIGLAVQSHSGQRLGAVLDIVFGAGGAAPHLIVVHASGDGAPGTLTAVPWKLAIKHLRGGALIFKAKRFADAPAFPPGDWPKLDTPDWSAAADAYWSRTEGPSFTPIDPTTRSRARPTMNL